MIKNAGSMQISESSLIENNDEDGNSQSNDDGKKAPCQKVAVKDDVLENVFIGKIPVMVMSNICYLADMQMEERKRVGQCHFDGGGYFIINGSEKVQFLFVFMTAKRA